MKNIKPIYILLATALLLQSCEQDITKLEPAVTPVDTSCEDAKAGDANFTKFVAIGNSFVAGFQAGALFNEGQANSLPAILNKQFECAGGSAEFNQPSINASLGWNLFITQPFITDNTKPVLGRLLLQYGTTEDCATGDILPKPTPQAYKPGILEAVPNPLANPGFIYAGDKTKLNNFGVPAVTLGQLLTPATGNWGASTNIAFNPFYARFASDGGTGTSKIISDAAAAGGSFFLFWAGLDDFFLYAAFGGNNDPSTPAATRPPLTDTEDFNNFYNAALSSTSGLLASNPNLKGVVANFPDIFKMPHFTAVTYNPIPLDAATATALTTGFAGYNAALDGLIANKVMFEINDELAAEIGLRKAIFTAGCNNKILIVDQTLTDLGPYFDGLKTAGAIDATQRAKLAPYEQVRQTTPSDIIPLATGSVLGTPGTFGVNGLSEPLGDRWVIIPVEKDSINAARTAFNATVKSFADANTTRVAFADVDAALEALITKRAAFINGVTITPNINPPTGIYSEDGVHPNSRGYAFLSNVFINAINAKFNSTVPQTNISKYSATALPIPSL